MIKKGDTLIEVTLAIGIFSMVAIAVVAVMISGTSNAQTTLETTLAREEIDAQAEAIRFIHDSYISDMENGGSDEESPYVKLWESITTIAYTNNIPTFSTSTCESPGDNSGNIIANAFVINTRALSNLTGSDVSDALIKYSSNTDKFTKASTYPRLIYNTNNNGAALLNENKGETVQKAEGIYAIAVKDPGTINIAGTTASAYYDFYIRTCWYGTGSDTPSTISTVIRLFDPSILSF